MTKGDPERKLVHGLYRMGKTAMGRYPTSLIEFQAEFGGLVHGCRSCEGAADRIGRRPVPDRHDRSTLCRTSTTPSAAIIFPRSSTGCATGGTTKLGCAGAGP